MSPANATSSNRAATELRVFMASQDNPQLEARISAVIQRIGDRTIIQRVAAALRSGEAQPVFALLVDEDSRVRDAAHECALLRYAYVAAIAAAAMGFDADERDELVQRTFMTLPQAVRRARERSIDIPHPVGWLRRRAYLIAREMLREERGTPSRVANGGPMPVESRPASPHGRRVSMDEAEGVSASAEDALLDALDVHRADATLASALDILAAERPLWADILRLHYLEGRQLDDVARRLGRAHGTIRNQARDARNRLGEIIRTQFPQLADTITTESRHPHVIPRR
jgi:DNA-directed RNA polymerase specialized sigma24 family protein